MLPLLDEPPPLIDESFSDDEAEVPAADRRVEGWLEEILELNGVTGNVDDQDGEVELDEEQEEAIAVVLRQSDPRQRKLNRSMLSTPSVFGAPRVLRAKVKPAAKAEPAAPKVKPTVKAEPAPTEPSAAAPRTRVREADVN